jgi:hypothetical protein
MLLLLLACRVDNELKVATDTSLPGDECTPSLWYEDDDGDGFGAEEVEACEQPEGTVEDNTDCDDTDADVHPEAEESCNDVDDDCDTEVDEGLDQTWYADQDADGFGDPLVSVEDCAQPSNTVDDNTDCDDADALINPSIREECNGYDDDCDALVDMDDDDLDPAELGTWYLDNDLDSYGGEAVQDCFKPEGTVSNDDDCDDDDAAVYPNALVEVTVKACIDGSDWVTVQGDQLWWEHRNHTTVGLHASCTFSETFVNGVAWTPTWTGSTSSATTVDYGLPAAAQTVSVAVISARGSVSVTQQPDASNSYTTQVLFDDDPTGAAATYEATLQYEVCL